MRYTHKNDTCYSQYAYDVQSDPDTGRAILLSFIHVYGPIAESEASDKDDFYDTLSREVENTKET